MKKGTTRRQGRTASGIALVLVAGACTGSSKVVTSRSAGDSGATASGMRVSACALMSKDDINGITGDSFSVAEPNDDGHSTRSGCRYSTAENPGYGVTLDVSWITARDYSDPAQHAALQHASIGGAQLGGKLAAQSGGGSMPGVRTGPVEGVGDEAYLAAMTLSARKGDYTVMVQAMPDLAKLARDSTLGLASETHEKAIANEVLSKL